MTRRGPPVARPRQCALEQQRRHPGRRLPLRDVVTAGIQLGPEAVATYCRDVCPVGDRQMREDPRHRRGSGSHRALPEVCTRRRLPDRLGGPVRRDVFRCRRGAGRTVEPARRNCRHRVSDFDDTSTRQRLRRVGPSYPAQICGKACIPCRCSSRCGSPSPRRAAAELLAGPIEDDAAWSKR